MDAVNEELGNVLQLLLYCAHLRTGVRVSSTLFRRNLSYCYIEQFIEE